MQPWYAEVYLAESNAINLLCQPLVIEGTPAQDVARQLLLSGPTTERPDRAALTAWSHRRSLASSGTRCSGMQY